MTGTCQARPANVSSTSQWWCQNIHEFSIGRRRLFFASWPLGVRMSSDVAPMSSELEAAVYKTSSNPRKMAPHASGLGARQPRENWTGEFAGNAQAIEGEKVKTAHSP